MENKPHHISMITGKVIKKAGNKSVTVLVERRVMHPKYHKFVKRFKKYIVHDENNELHIGDVIEAIETRPISARKRFKLKRVVKTAMGVEE